MRSRVQRGGHPTDRLDLPSIPLRWLLVCLLHPRLPSRLRWAYLTALHVRNIRWRRVEIPLAEPLVSPEARGVQLARVMPEERTARPCPQDSPSKPGKSMLTNRLAP